MDPLAADYAAWSPYNYVLGNPIIFIDPDGRTVDDRIEVDKGGDIVSIIRTEGENIFIDSESGERIFLHDANGADSDLLTRRYDVGEQLFIPMAIGEVNQMINQAGTKPKELLQNWIPFDAHVEVRELSSNGNVADFPIQLSLKYDFELVTTVDAEGNAFLEVIGMPIRFDDSNLLYNPSDAGQFIWGAWMQENTFSLERALWGANMNERETGGDSEADQQAITNGYIFNESQ